MSLPFKFLIGFLGISIILIVHELGHFISAKLLGVEVEALAFGLGPKIFSYKGKKTEYSFSLLPFGAYTRLYGSTDLKMALRVNLKQFERVESGSIFSISPLKRLLIFLSGPVINILLALFLFTIISFISVEALTNKAYVDKVCDYQELYNINIDQRNIISGDLILELDNIKVDTYEEFTSYLKLNNKASHRVKVLRDNKIIDTTIESIDGYYGLTLHKKPIISKPTNTLFNEGDEILSIDGIKISSTNDFYKLIDLNSTLEILRDGKIVFITFSKQQTYPFTWKSDITLSKPMKIGSAIKNSIIQTVDILKSITNSIINILGGRSKNTRDEITGPTRAATEIGYITSYSLNTSFRSGVRTLLYLLSTVSLSIAFVNLLPLPSFDGGQIMINLLQIITKREFSPMSYIIYHVVGIILSIIFLLLLYFVDFKYYFLS